MQTVLREGDRGPEVLALQRKLTNLGFSPGLADGFFGPATEAAVLGFQRSWGLLADGIVGPLTAATLAGREPGPEEFPPIRGISVSLVSAMMPYASVANIQAHLPLVLAALAERGLSSKPVVLAALATIRAETAGFVPISEGVSRFNTAPGGPAFGLYDFRRDLGNGAIGDGKRFCGRGFVQLTGAANYRKFGPRVGVPDLLKNPDRANLPDVAAKILAAFIDVVEIPFKEALLRDDLAAARRLVNGGSHGLDAFVEAYRVGQRRLAYPPDPVPREEV